VGLSSLLAESIVKDADRYSSFSLSSLLVSHGVFLLCMAWAQFTTAFTHGITASHHGITFLRDTAYFHD
jgi:hypothetical protein